MIFPVTIITAISMLVLTVASLIRRVIIMNIPALPEQETLQEIRHLSSMKMVPVFIGSKGQVSPL